MGVDEETLRLFLQEGQQLLEQLDALLLSAESAGGLTSSQVNELFRLAHTLKGSAAMIGQDALAQTAHLTEDLLQLTRQNPDNTQMTAAVLSCCLDFTAYYRDALIRMEQGGTPADSTGINSRLLQLAGEQPAPAPGSASGTIAAEYPVDLNRFVRCRVFVQPCALASLRCFLLHRAISGACEESYTLPDKLQIHPELDQQIQQEGFELGFIPKSGITVENVLALLKKQPLFDRLEVLSKPKALSAEDSPSKVSVRVNVSQEQINRLINRNAELLVAETALEQRLCDLGILDSYTKRLLRTVTMHSVWLQNDLNELGMTSLHSLFLRMQRLARDLLLGSGKQADILIEGSQVMVDTGMMEPLNEMLLHVVRNAVDHGLETQEERTAAGKPLRGLIRLSAERRNGRLLLTVTDDGRGINSEKVLAVASARGLLEKPASDYTRQEIFDFLLLGGFTTKSQVSQSSGRGVGLDAVHHLVRKIGGDLQIISAEGQGAMFLFDLPQSVTAVDVLRLSRKDRICYVPVNVVERVIPLSAATLMVDGSLISREQRYRNLLPMRKGEKAVLFHTDTAFYYITCDAVGEPESLLLRPLPVLLKRILGDAPPYSGCIRDTLGGVYMLFDIENLAAMAE